MQYLLTSLSILLLASLCASGLAATAEDRFEIRYSESPWGIQSLKRSADSGLDFIRSGSVLGDVTLRCRTDGNEWQEVTAGKPAEATEASRPGWSSITCVYTAGSGSVRFSREFRVRNGKLFWTLEFENVGQIPVEVGDVAIPLPMNNAYTRSTEETFERRVFRHAFVSGEGSFVYWQPVGGTGPYLVMSALRGTPLEFFTSRVTDYAWGGGDYRVFVHSAASAELEKRGTWRQKRTSLTLKPGQSKTYTFAFSWAENVAGVRKALVDGGGIDVRVLPGMVVPRGQTVNLALRSADKILSLTAEHAAETVVNYSAKRSGYSVYRVRFSKLGENMLTVARPGGRKTVLEFFVTEPVETLIQKRAAFIATKQQHRDPSKWYDGLFSLWDVRQPEGKNLLGPDNLGGQYPYAVSGSDDPSNSKPIYLSEKNVVYPDLKEIEALEYYLRHFVWGKLQRTDQETPHPYGIYGCDSWYGLRNAPTGLNSGGHGQERMWRTFDYTTLFTVYFNMYRIASTYPSACKYLDARGYLERAYGTARAYYEVPYNINMQGWDFAGWCDWAYTIGNFHEKYLIGLIDALERAGEHEKADYLRRQWETKVRFFVCGDKYPWTSEMPVDSTAFESTYAAARYAAEHKLPALDQPWVNKNNGKSYPFPAVTPAMVSGFVERQLRANIACRGWLESSYYQLGSDFRALGSGGYNLSYMSQMGGWAVLDYGVRFANDPADWIQLGYASMLSSWALVNTGDEKSGYGYWYPGKLHDGSVGWGFMPQQLGSEWNPACQGIPRGSWPVDGEIDHGLVAGIEGASTVVYEDPIFGLVCCGGTVEPTGKILKIVPDDGVRKRVDILFGGRRVHISLDRDGFKKGRPIVVNGNSIALELERRVPLPHNTRVTVGGVPEKTLKLTVNGHKVGVKQGVGEIAL